MTGGLSEVEAVRQYVQRVDAGEPLESEVRAEALSLLARFECWEPYFKLLRSSWNKQQPTSVQDLVLLAKVQYRSLEEIEIAAQSIAQSVQGLRLSYGQLREEVLSEVLYPDDWFAESAILEEVLTRLHEDRDRVLCLERLCLIYEKKLHNEVKLQKSFEKILSIDSRNVKALRYFKLAYSQSGDWEEVVAILKSLIESAHFPQEVFRYAQELAGVCLYQLDQPVKAIEVLETYCADSPLDTSTIQFDAYQRMGDQQGCLKVLRGSLVTVDGTHGQSIIHFKIGEIEEASGRLDEALAEYEISSQLNPRIMEPIERAIQLRLGKEDWAGVAELLDRLMDCTKDQVLKDKIRDAQQRMTSRQTAPSGKTSSQATS